MGRLGCAGVGRGPRALSTLGKLAEVATLRFTMRRLVWMMTLLPPMGCAAAEPGTVFGKPTVEVWEAEKRDRLNACQHDPKVESEKDAHRCLGGYDRHRGTDTCVDATAWVSRVRNGNTE